MRVYGTKHNIKNIQLVNEANILLDDKSGKLQKILLLIMYTMKMLKNQ